jgi:thiol:disulfide interchange protein DsbC
LISVASLRAALLCTLSLVAGFAHADEAAVRRAVQAWVGPDNRIESIAKAGFLDLYEVRIGSDVLYVDAQGRYAVVGDVLDLGTRRNLTQERKAELSRINFADLPLELAAKQVKGKGRRVLATFEDPNCPFCRKLALELDKMDDITIYTFLLPILSQDSITKSRAIWCAKDKATAWHDWIVNGKAPVASTADPRCEAPIDKLQALGRRYNITGTPTIFLTDGTRLGGYVPAPQLEQALGRAAQQASRR